MKQYAVKAVVVLASVFLIPADASRALGLTIHDVQYSNGASGWQSAYAGQVVDVTGGVVTYASAPPGKSFVRVVIQDPNLSEWGGVEIKVLSGTLSIGVGDLISLTGVCVDESSKARGTTYLLYDPNEYGSGFSVLSSGNIVEPTVVSPSTLGAGDSGSDPNNAEKYEGMLLAVENVTVGSLGFGSHNDNYELTSAEGTCWASDYFNVGRNAADLYHTWTSPGQSYSAVIGIVEQYTKSSDAYDYYQLLTRSSADFVPEPAAIMLMLTGGSVILRKRRQM